MLYFTLKVLVSSILIAAASELARRSTLLGALLASVPLVSVLALVWLYIDTRNPERVAAFAGSIFWLVLPSLILFVTLPLLLRLGINFVVSLGISAGATVAGYFLLIAVLKKAGIAL